MTDNLIAKWGLIFALIALSCWLFIEGNINLGIDLRGGRSITYEFRKESFEKIPQADRQKALDDTIDTISKRIDTLGVRELTTRKIGSNQFVIEAPKMTDADLAAIKTQLLALGNLEFLIGIDEWTPSNPLDVQGDRADEFQKYGFDKAKADAQRKVAYETGKNLLGAKYLDGEAYTLLDDSRSPPRELPIVWMPIHPTDTDPNRVELENAKAGKPTDHSKILGHWLYRDPHYFGPGKEGFTGIHIKDVSRSSDRLGQRAVSFNIERLRQDDFGEYTEKFVNKLIALCLNDEVWSQATINEKLTSSVQISRSSGYGQDEQSFLLNCLTSGSLRLKPRQASEEAIGPALGEAAIKRGIIASILAGVVIVAFMLWYYRFSGLVACAALMLNVFFIMSVMVLFQATLSLPSIAGIILSLGVAVDANILVFERTREELHKGKPLLPALVGGYHGAFPAIFDSNLTSAITAALMIHFGTGPIRGFGTTLLAGLIIHMFTALFVTKAIFGLWIKNGWMTTIHFIDLFKEIKYPWMAKARPWQIGSAAMSLLAVILFFATGDSKYGLDFTGGTAARMKLATATTRDDVDNTVKSIKTADGKQKYAQPKIILRSIAEGADGGKSPEFDLELHASEEVSDAQVKSFVENHLKKMFPDKVEGDGVPSLQSSRPGEWKVEILFKEPLPVATVRTTIDAYPDEYLNRPFAGTVIEAVDATTVEDPNQLEAPTVKAKRYTLEVGRQDVAAGSAVADLKRAFAGKLAATDSFTHVSYLGPNVVASLKESAIVSMIFALAAIILYLWFRFKEVKYGVAGVIALIHDVTVPVGLGILFNWLGILNVPITLTSIAAFLTIIGYSINDTIVIFDRVRENLGHIKGTYREIMDISISQTLGRTILTVVTVIGVLLVLFLVNIGSDSPIEGLAFTLLIGTLCGSYSTIFIACPYAVWVTERRERRKAAPPKPQRPATAALSPVN